MTALERLHQSAWRETRCSNRHPPPAGVRSVGREFALKVMRVVYGDSVDRLPAGQEDVPDLFERRCPTTSVIVHCRMPIPDLEQSIALDLPEFLDPERPSKIGMIDVRHGVDFAHSVDVRLDGRHEGLGGPGLDEVRNVQPVHVHRSTLEARRHFFTGDEEEGGVDQMGECFRVGEYVVIRQDQEVVTVLLVPPRDVLRRGVAITLRGVGMCVAFEPLAGPVGHRKRSSGGICRVVRTASARDQKRTGERSCRAPERAVGC